jgi:hypothetical protein
VLNGTRTGIRTGQAQFRNLRVELRLELSLEWAIDINLVFTHIRRHGTIPLGLQTPTIPVGNLTLPGLQQFDLNLSTVSVDQLQASIGPLSDLTLGGVTAEQVRVADVTAPVGDFTISGLGLGGVSLEGIQLPDAAIGATTVAHLKGDAFPLGSVTIPNLDLPGVDAGHVVGGQLDSTTTSNPIDFVANAGIIKVTLALTPGVRLQADELILDGVNVALSVGSIELHDVVVPYEVLNLTLSQIGIQTVDVPKIQVG